MSNFLERTIAVICAGVDSSESDTLVTSILSEQQASWVRFSLADLAAFDAEKYDGIVLCEISTADVAIASHIEKIVRRFHSESKPIAVIGRSVIIVAAVFGATGVEITAGRDEASTLFLALKQTGAIHTLCAANDFISDRDHKILTTPGSLFPMADTAEGIRKMVRELVEMA